LNHLTSCRKKLFFDHRAKGFKLDGQRMIGKNFKMFAGRHCKKSLRQCRLLVAKIKTFEEEYQGLNDGQ
jgi:hypothetical protein